ncbi:MAG: hypothetical protein AAGU27_18955 [Dehalobacterium sp.]
MTKSGKTGHDNRNNQEIPEALTDCQRAEEALKQAKNRSKHC